MRNHLSKLFPCASGKRIIKRSSKKTLGPLEAQRFARNNCFHFSLWVVSHAGSRDHCRQLPSLLPAWADDRQTCRPGFEEVRWIQASDPLPVLRRASDAEPSAADPGRDGGESDCSFGGFRLDADGTLWRDEAIVHLPPKELAALRLLLANAGQVVSPMQLKHALWGDVHVTADSVLKCLSSLRARLEPESCIQTVYKRGYRFTAEVLRQTGQARQGAPTAGHPALRLPSTPSRNIWGTPLPKRRLPVSRMHATRLFPFSPGIRSLPWPAAGLWPSRLARRSKPIWCLREHSARFPRNSVCAPR